MAETTKCLFDFVKTLVFLFLAGGLFYLRVVHIYSLNFSQRGSFMARFNSLQSVLGSYLGFSDTYLRIAPVFCDGGVYLLGRWAGYTAYGHGASGMKVGTHSGRLPGRAIAHNRQSSTNINFYNSCQPSQTTITAYRTGITLCWQTIFKSTGRKSRSNSKHSPVSVFCDLFKEISQEHSKFVLMLDTFDYSASVREN